MISTEPEVGFVSGYRRVLDISCSSHLQERKTAVKMTENEVKMPGAEEA
jgi:hypothetical protein